jgi:hypothetical protein
MVSWVASAATTVVSLVLLALPARGGMNAGDQFAAQPAAAGGETIAFGWRPRKRALDIKLHELSAAKPHLSEAEEYASDLRLVFESVELSNYSGSLTNDSLPRATHLEAVRDVGDRLQSAEVGAVQPAQSASPARESFNDLDQLVPVHAVRGRRRWCSTPDQFAFCHVRQPRDASFGLRSSNPPGYSKRLALIRYSSHRAEYGYLHQRGHLSEPSHSSPALGWLMCSCGLW